MILTVEQGNRSGWRMDPVRAALSQPPALTHSQPIARAAGRALVIDRIGGTTATAITRTGFGSGAKSQLRFVCGWQHIAGGGCPNLHPCSLARRYHRGLVWRRP